MTKEELLLRISNDITNKTTNNSISPVTVGDIMSEIVNMDGEHLSSTIKITADDLDGCLTCDGLTLEDKIAQYIISLNISDIVTKGDVWIEYDDLVFIPVEFGANDLLGKQKMFFHNGGDKEPILGDTLYYNVGVETGEGLNDEFVKVNNTQSVPILSHIPMTTRLMVEVKPPTYLRINDDSKIYMSEDMDNINYTLIQTNKNFNWFKGRDLTVYIDSLQPSPEVGDALFYSDSFEYYPIKTNTNVNDLTLPNGEILIYPNGYVSMILSNTYKVFNTKEGIEGLNKGSVVITFIGNNTTPDIGDELQIYYSETNEFGVNYSLLSELTKFSDVLTGVDIEGNQYHFDTNNIITNITTGGIK